MALTKLSTIIVKRSESVHVKTLHTVLRLNVKCIQAGTIQNEVAYVNDDSHDKVAAIQEHLKRSDKILFIDFGISMDDNSIEQVLQLTDGVGCLVFPGVKEGIDWEMFKQKVNDKVDEPVTQMGLHFDTQVGNKIKDDFYSVASTSAKCWVVSSKHIIRSMRDKRSGKLNLPSVPQTMFERMKEKGVKIQAYTASKLTFTHPHECISNLLNSAGVKAN